MLWFYLIMNTIEIGGIVTQGFRIASGLNKDGVPGPYGITIKDSFVQQRPFFEAELPELKEVWTGTINVDISPRIHRMIGFTKEITCEWHPRITETFGLVTGITLKRNNQEYPAIIYYPMPSEFHEPRMNVIEILAPKIEGLAYGDKVELVLPTDKVVVE